MSNSKVIQTLLRSNTCNRKLLFFSSSSSSADRLAFAAIPTETTKRTFRNHHPSFSSSCSVSDLVGHSWKPTSAFAASSVTLRSLKTSSSEDIGSNDEDPVQYETEEEVEGDNGWEEEEEVEPEIGDGGDGGGVVLQNVPWGERALSIAHEVLLKFGDDMKLYAFKTTPRGYIYVRLDKLPNEYGCPSMEEIESYSQEYKKRLDEVGARGEIPDNLALEVSSPGAERLLKVPDDLYRFKDLPMRVCYVEDVESKCPEKNKVFLLESVDTETGNCMWKLADVKENRDFLGKVMQSVHGVVSRDMYAISICNGTISECLGEIKEFLMESEINKRHRLASKPEPSIGHGSLNKDKPACKGNNSANLAYRNCLK